MRIDGTRNNDRATEVVLAYLSAANRGDLAAMLALLSDEVAHDFGNGQRESGKPAFAAYLHAHAGQREQLRDIVVMTSPDGARAAAEFMVRGEPDTAADTAGRAASNRKHRVRPGGLFFAIRDGQIERVSNYQSRSQADAPAPARVPSGTAGTRAD